MKIAFGISQLLFCNLIWYFYFKKKKIGFCSLKPDTKKAKTEDKEECEEGSQASGETEHGVEKSDDEEEDSEVPSLPLGVTGNFHIIFQIDL